MPEFRRKFVSISHSPAPFPPREPYPLPRLLVSSKLANEETFPPPLSSLIFESLIPFLGRTWNEGWRGRRERTNGRRTERNGSPTTLKIAVPSARETTLLEYQSNSQFVQMRLATRCVANASKKA